MVQNKDDSWRPVPDPTVLTTAALLREIAALKELLELHINSLTDIVNQKFDNIDTRFQDLDKLRSQTATNNKEALDAALTAQRDSATKTEAAFTKQIDQLQVIVNTISRASDEKVDDLKTRLDLNEGKSKGLGEGWGILIGAIGIATAVLIAASHYIK